ncbi:DUF6608 family protein [Alkalicoccus halolimnae]|uniref:DUF6608 family protein n=1 Tax=Alkalicoccus halolimnae TaxID=1667239 RepID=A0A5C7EZI3_9BACI|nr:DUF6608 family protein [Alkalicoccus halolimnae]TXF81817.1 hypothetical protein FTX54_15350 [Alkalicoccus halolimnae]
MKIGNGNSKMPELYTKILNNKFVTVCILFTVITLLDTIPILLGLWPAKIGEGPYIHLLGRFILLSLLVNGLYIFDTLRKRIKSKLLLYIMTFILTWAILLAYVWSNSLFTELHPDAFIDASISYAFMYLLLGIIIFIVNKVKKNSER